MNTSLFEEKSISSTKIEECGKGQKKLFKLARNLMGRNSDVDRYLYRTPGGQVKQLLHGENNNHQK